MTFFDEDGQPTTDKDHHAGWRPVLDAWGNTTAVRYLDFVAPVGSRR